MPGEDQRAAAPGSRPASGSARNDAGDSPKPSRNNAGGGGGAGRPLPGERGRERAGAGAERVTELRKQTLSGFPLEGTGRRLGALAIQPPAILHAPSSLLSGPLFLHPVPPFRAASLPPPVAAPLLFAPPAQSPRPAVPADSTAASTQTPDAAQPAEVPSPKVELSVTSTAIDTASTSVETPFSTNTALAATSPAPSPESAITSTTSESGAPDIVPIAFATGEPVAASLVDSSFTSPGASDILPVTNSGVGVGGKVAAACVIGAVFLLLLNWAFWLVIRRRRRARRSIPAHWDFAAPPAGRDSEDALGHSEDERDAKGGIVTGPV